ncbi:putative zinc-binding metallopeptidase [Hymenobacter saemangeumensis]|uniref:Zinc-binding metallopeptidase n=1 Tax=Hymenobacter saemangeumensis TaxID=1084522 RepID=A0ABP8I0G3_9BACT
MEPQADEVTFRLFGQPDSATYAYCQNHEHEACNWLVPTDCGTPFCTACALNRTIPNLQEPENLARWQKLEVAKHRLVFSLLCLRLPVISQFANPGFGLAFDFKADEGPENKVLTGHDEGLITLNIAEADSVQREQTRQNMAEAYRTLLGHFRHEVGHYYWDRLINNTPNLEECRRLFGDDREDYGKALERHYAEGPPADWPERYISAYATTHAWEDWAETWAHYLHIMDTLQTAHAFGLSVDTQAGAGQESLEADISRDPYAEEDFCNIMEQWLPLVFALNSLSRSMGQPDAYPFVIPPPAVEKLAFIHRVCRAGITVPASPPAALP